MLKKSCAVLLLILLIGIFSNILLASAQEPSIPYAKEAEKLQELSDKIPIDGDTASMASGARDYLKEEWGNMLLKNKYLAAIHSFFQKISIVFFIFFGQEYSFSLKLILIIVLWFYFLFMFGGILKNFSTFSKAVSYTISLVFVIVAAHLKIWEWQVDLLLWFIFVFLLGSNNPWWYSLIGGLIVVLVLVLLFFFLSKFGKAFKETKEKAKIEQEKIELEAAAKGGKAFTGTVGGAMGKLKP